MDEEIMDKETGGYLTWESSPEPDADDTDFSTTFCDNHPDESKLEFRRLCRTYSVQIYSKDSTHYWEPKLCLGRELNQLAQLSDPCQIFYIRQKHSYSRLFITRYLFEELLRSYSIFSCIWDFMLPFSFKTHESDIGQSPYRFHQLGPASQSELQSSSFECAYGFRYVALNRRHGMTKDNPDYDPWSVRQTAVYQQYNASKDKLIFLLVTPAHEAEINLGDEVLRIRNNGKRLNPFHLHSMLVATMHENWRLYIRSLEHSITNQSNRITLAEVQSETERLSPLTNININFVDRQRLKMTEDKILDLVVIFESLQNTLSKLHLQCRNHCMGNKCVDCHCTAVLEAFEDQMQDVQLNLKKADVLHRRAQSTAKLLSDLLEYENAHTGHLNERLLNGLVKETNDENLKIVVLTERSTQDAAAVRILTVITLIYLPMTVVASIFSSQLIRVNENGQVSVVTGAYWFAVVTVPLTVATFVAWRIWLSRTVKEYERRTSRNPKVPPTEKHKGGRGLVSFLCLLQWPVRIILSVRNQGRARHITDSGREA